MKTFRLLIVNYHAASVGGVEEYLRAVVPAIAQQEFHVGFLSRSPNEKEELGFTGLRSVDLLCADPSPPQIFAENALRWKPDIVYVHGLGDPAYETWLCRSIPTVVFRHNYGGLCASGTKCLSFPNREPCQRSFGVGCLTRWYPRRCGGLNPMTALKQYAIERRRHRSLPEPAALVVASHHMAEEMTRNGVPRDRVHTIHYPLTAKVDFAPPRPRPGTDRLLFVGRITDLKGWWQLVQAIPLAEKTLGRELDLVVAGDGPDRVAFEKAARQAGITASFLGWVNPERREVEMRKADVLVVPSVWPEPFGLVGIEAGAVGLPAVAFAVGGIPDWLIAGVSGEMAPGEKPTAAGFADALVRALRDDDHRNKLGLGAWEKAKTFTMEAHLEKLLPLFESAIRVGKSPYRGPA
ncbi:MAG: glycosyltransferase family 4 protein [Fimbriiglobus sp.]